MSPTRALMATPLQYAVEGHFAPFVRLTLSTLTLAVGAMFVVATTRTASAFAEPQSYLGRFVNREFYADYSPAAERPTHIIAVTLNPEGGAEAARTVEITSFTELRPEILDSANADAAALDRVPREGRAADAGTNRAANVGVPHGSSGENADGAASDGAAPARAAMQADADPDHSGDSESSESTSDTRLSTTGGPTATPDVKAPGAPVNAGPEPDAPAPRPSGRPTRAPAVEAEVPAPTRVPVPSAEPVSTHQPHPTVQATPDRRNIEVPAPPGSDIALPTVKPTTPVGPPEAGGTGGGIPTATPPPSSSGDPGPLGTVPTVIPTLVPPIVPTAVPPVLTVVPFVQPTQPPSSGSGGSGSGGSGSGGSGSGGSGSGGSGSGGPGSGGSGSGGSGSGGGGLPNPIPTLVPTVPPVPPTVGSLLRRI